MCYLRHLHIQPQDCSIYEKQLFEQSSQAPSEENSFHALPILPVVLPNFINSNQKYLRQLFELIHSNSRLIESIENKLASGCQMEEEYQNKWLAEMEDQRRNEENMDDLQQKMYKDEIVMKLFENLIPNYGENHFKFKLSLDQNLPSKLYKNRKMKINVKLLPCAARSSKIVYNSNPLHICIGIFDKDGNWVQQNIHGEPIINGETQVNLYQGKAEFSRLLFNEISSNMPKQKMNIAIYVKPTGVLYEDNQKNIGNNVNWRMIKPLTLKNVQILSKKRKKIEEDLE